ncbi:MAG TPA: hypothetical protein VFS75_03460 [Candidatus Paceibacterota bacterium]|nr:hypothetical protein [Candidatus Paceibacterota bacterium]
MRDIQTVPDLYNEFDSIVQLSGQLVRVQAGGRFGIFSLETMEEVVPVECEEVVPLDGDRFRVTISKKRGIFSATKNEFAWE